MKHFDVMMAQPTPDPIYLLRGCGSPITALHFLSVNQQSVLASGDSQGSLHIWDLETKRIRENIIHQSGETILWIDQDLVSTQVLSQSRAGTVHIWSPTNGAWIKSGSIKSARLGFCAGCLVGTGPTRLLAVPSASSQSQIDVFDLNTQHIVTSLKPDMSISSQKYGMCMAVKSVGQTSGNDNKLLIGYEDGSVALWDITAHKILHQYKVHKESVMCLDYCETKNLGITGSTDNNLITWRMNDEEIAPYKEVKITNGGVNDVVIRNDQKIFATAGWDSQIRVFGVKKLTALAVLSCHTESVQCLTFSPNNVLACGSRDSCISLWDIYK